jgi:hypothetical protein
MSQFPKTCSCGRTSTTPSAWRRLKFVGRTTTPEDEEGPAETLELRNCECGSTITIIVDTSGYSFVTRYSTLDDARRAGQRVAEDLMVDVEVDQYVVRFEAPTEAWTQVATIVREYNGRLGVR